MSDNIHTIIIRIKAFVATLLWLRSAMKSMPGTPLISRLAALHERNTGIVAKAVITKDIRDRLSSSLFFLIIQYISNKGATRDKTIGKCTNNRCMCAQFNQKIIIALRVTPYYFIQCNHTRFHSVSTI
jgi:hypothetical protein